MYFGSFKKRFKITLIVMQTLILLQSHCLYTFPYFLTFPLYLEVPTGVILYKKAFLKNFAIFTGKHLCWSLCLIKLQAFRHRCFPVNIAKIFRTPILKNICKRLLLFTVFANTCFVQVVSE